MKFSIIFEIISGIVIDKKLMFCGLFLCLVGFNFIVFVNILKL